MRKKSVSKLFNKPIKIILLTITSFTAGYETHRELYPNWENNLDSIPMVNVCFTPGNNCTKLINQVIDRASKNILIQSYSFTSQEIADSLVNAKKRGVNIKIIADKINLTEKYSKTNYLNSHGIKLYYDKSRSGLAHNKIMIIDEEFILTGSYNWTSGAQERNSENLLLIKDKDMARIYTYNWLNNYELILQRKIKKKN